VGTPRETGARAMDADARALVEVQLASLLDIEPNFAREALRRCGYCLDAAVDVACELSLRARSGGGASSSSSAAPEAAAPAAPAAPAAAAARGALAPELGSYSGDEVDDTAGRADGVVPPAPAAEPWGDVAASASREPRAKRKRTGFFPLPAGTQLRGNHDDQPARNPPRFKQHPLREEQRKSLAWMLAQERSPAALKGGLLADQTGYGKTATAIGLVSLGRSRAPAAPAKSGYIMSAATLILCPPRLVQQWEEEFVKFLGGAVEIWRSSFNAPPRQTKASTKPGLKLLILEAHRKAATGRFVGCMPFGITAAHFKGQFDVVLTSSELQVKQSYVHALREAANAGGFTDEVCISLRERLKGGDHDGLMEPCKFPVFQAFWWHRIILDEFHESESWVYRVRELVKATGATHRWGLSGTPPLGSCEAVSQVAELLWFPELEHAPGMEEALALDKRFAAYRDFAEDGTKLSQLQQEVKRFLDTFVRQNSSELIERIRVEEHVQLVDHIPEERLIYRQACHDHQIFDLQGGYQDVGLEAREALLKRCAHFDISGSADSARSAVRRLGDSKEERIKSVERQLRIDAGRAMLLRCWPDCQKVLRHPANRRQAHTDAAAFVARLVEEPADSLSAECQRHGWRVKKELVTAQGELRLRPEIKLQQPLEQAECYGSEEQCHAVTHEVARRCDPEAAELLGALQMCERVCGRFSRGVAARRALVEAMPGLARHLDEACRSLDFYKAQLRGVMGGSQEEECAICLEPMNEIKNLTLLPCAHIFHTSCIKASLQQQQKCPHCQSPAQLREMTAMVMEVRAREPAPVASRTAELPAVLRAHGSKLNAIAARLRAIRCEDPTAQVIVFVQWCDLEDNVAKAFVAHGVPFIRPVGKASLGDNMKCFQEGRGPWVLMLSLERAASGLQLTAANHVVFVHPMNALSLSVARDYEHQAIGRIRRIGQTRDLVHVWRFVTRDTVEEHISRLHGCTHV